MGSSAKTGKNFFEGHRSTFWIKMPFGIGHPPPTHQLQSTCVGEGSRVPNLQTEFKLSRFVQKLWHFSDFVVPTWSPVVLPSSPSSPHRPCHPHIVPTSSPHHPRCPHVPIATRRSPCGPHTSSPSSTCHPHRPPSSPCCPHSPQKVPCGLHGLWSPHVVPVIPVVLTLSPHRLEGPTSFPIPQIPTPPTPHPRGGALNQ